MAAPTPTKSLNPIPAAALFAAIAGLLSIRYAYFDGLTAALAALLLVAWGIARPESRGRWAGPVPPVVAALALVAVAWVVFLLPSPPVPNLRGLILGGAGLPLWLGFEPDGAVHGPGHGGT